MLGALERHHIVDYSIFYYPGLDLLIANMKYTGSDYAADMAKIAADPETQRWWAVTDGMQESFEPGATGSGKDVPWWTVSLVGICSTERRLLMRCYRSWKRSSGLTGNRERRAMRIFDQCIAAEHDTSHPNQRYSYLLRFVDMDDER